ncbi:hypothetical protein SAMN02799630_06009 [Paenibacillus sp. UNCCL117]|uniref:hypothetical protein n=1 Tax=unclassified Paenibacillus TaxID=185978 RepID=UPI00088BAD77|nr:MULTISPECIES: hypothetical protein [unclassified Paenibacillus]SDE65690.1 hypothetical protein SAMN04488602_1394 [Paenibacillus sp. cl123]SFW70397.1 hypothetical protein SAMN02799630_06009 [Paenibacillus sp. UNCCL117]
MNSYIRRIGIKRALSAVLALPLLWSAAPLPQAEASAATATASIPSFTVKVNGTVIDNAKQRYPFLIYKDITYFPLTWDNTQALGLQTNWSATDGLAVYLKQQGGGSDWKPVEVKQDLTGSNPAGLKARASVAAYPISLPGTQLDNASEPYPFLEFRDVTYMPLTWRFTRELLQLGIEWDEKQGLSVTGGQELIGSIFYDDADYLYAYPRVFLDATHRALKIPKSLQGQPVWLSKAEVQPLEEKIYTGRRDIGSEPVKLEQKGTELYIGDRLLRKLKDEETQILGDTKPLYEAVRFPIDEKRSLISLHIYWSIPVIGPPPGGYHLYLDEGGQYKGLMDGSWVHPERVIPNPDGTVWIAKSYNALRYGPATLYLLGADNTLHDVNDKLSSPDLVTLGSLSRSLKNPASSDGSLIVQMSNPWHTPEQRKPEEGWGIYRLDTKLQATKLNYPEDGQLYMGTGHELYLLRPGTNTIIDLPRGQSRTWLDRELQLTG